MTHTVTQDNLCTDRPKVTQNNVISQEKNLEAREPPLSTRIRKIFDLGKPDFHEFHFDMNILFSEKYLWSFHPDKHQNQSDTKQNARKNCKSSLDEFKWSQSKNWSQIIITLKLTWHILRTLNSELGLGSSSKLGLGSGSSSELGTMGNFDRVGGWVPGRKSLWREI